MQLYKITDGNIVIFSTFLTARHKSDKFTNYSAQGLYVFVKTWATVTHIVRTVGLLAAVSLEIKHRKRLL